jgi:hyperosmotically inducible periplasmic protein
MKRSNNLTWIIAAAFAAALATGCDRNSPTDSAASKMDQSVGQTEQKTDQMASSAPSGVQSGAKQDAGNVADAMGDAAITAKVKTAMVTEPGLKAAQIDVDTSNGIVKLTGSVDTKQSIDRAIQVAQAVSGEIGRAHV